MDYIHKIETGCSDCIVRLRMWVQTDEALLEQALDNFTVALETICVMITSN